ncbi:MAG: quinone-dependent dihydroorotate dehydrogenase [Candidatus Paceibacterota bacterium]
MKDYLVRLRNRTISFLYKYLLKPIFFLNDPEVIHDKMVYLGNLLGKYKISRLITGISFNYRNDLLKQNVLGLDFENPIGLAAGFDKDAVLTDILPFIGFGFAEVGSITGNYCEGNPKPRLWRLPKSKALVVYYGLKNKGSEFISRYLSDKNFKIPVGTSVAMTNCKENLNILNAIEDYRKAFGCFVDIGQYFTINISCPNTLGGQPFSEPENLEKLLYSLDKIETNKPIFIKLSPDVSLDKLNTILDIADKHRVSGIICTNLTKKRDSLNIIEEVVPPFGGISGKVLQNTADDLLAYIYRKYKKRFILIGCGGVFSAEDAYKKIRSGATLVQIVTGLIYEGPQVVSQINQGLVYFLKRDRFKKISEAIGVDVI